MLVCGQKWKQDWRTGRVWLVFKMMQSKLSLGIFFLWIKILQTLDGLSCFNLLQLTQVILIFSFFHQNWIKSCHWLVKWSFFFLLDLKLSFFYCHLDGVNFIYDKQVWQLLTSSLWCQLFCINQSDEFLSDYFLSN